MEATLKALADLLLEAVPTIFFFIFLAWFLKRVYFRPMAAVFAERRKATEGVRELARKAAEAADQKQSEFERALDLARQEIYQEHERQRRQWAEQQAETIARTRAKIEEQIHSAKEQIARETEATHDALDAQTASLGDEIVRSLLERRVA